MKYVILLNGAKHSGRNTFINFVRVAMNSKDKRATVRCYDPMDRIRTAAFELGWTYDNNDTVFLDNLKQLADVKYNFTLSNVVDVIEKRARDGERRTWVSSSLPTVTKLQSPSTGKRELFFIFISHLEDGYAIRERYVNDPDVTVLGVYISRGPIERGARNEDLFPILIQNDYGLGTLMGQAETFVNTHIYGGGLAETAANEGAGSDCVIYKCASMDK